MVYRRGNGTSMISLIIPPKSQISQQAKMLAEEFVRVLSTCIFKGGFPCTY
jgi:peptide subunit release factor 1 (eRF1)